MAETDITRDFQDMARVIQKTAFSKIPQEDGLRLVERLDERTLRIMMSISGPHLEPRFVSQRIKVQRVLSNVSRVPVEMVAHLLAPVFEDARNLLTSEQFENPTETDFQNILTMWRTRWSEATVQASLAHVVLQELEAAPLAAMELARLQEHAEVLRAPEVDVPVDQEKSVDDVSAVAHGSESLPSFQLPDLNEHILTPLGRNLIRTALATAGEELGALSREEYELLLMEFTRLNVSYHQAWFHVGYAAALELVPQNFNMDSAALNDERFEWHMWGLIKGTQRMRNSAAMNAILKNPDQFAIVQRMLEKLMGIELFPYVIEHLLAVNHDSAFRLLESVPFGPVETIAHELEVARLIDDESVRLLRSGNAAAAVKILRSGRKRLEIFITQNEGTVKVPTVVDDLRVRLTIGIAASERLMRDHSSSTRELTSVKESVLEVATHRTQARYFVQLALTESNTTKIEDVALPRSQADKISFDRKFGGSELNLKRATELNPEAGDANYLLGGLAIAGNRPDEALNNLGSARLTYESSRQDRYYLLPLIIWQQIYQRMFSDGVSSVPEALKLLYTELPPEIRLQTEEVDNVMLRVQKESPNAISELLDWLGMNRESNHQAPTFQVLHSALDAVSSISPGLLNLIARVQSRRNRMVLLLTLLHRSLEASITEDTDAILDAIDELLAQGVPHLHATWAEACLYNESLRQYLSIRAADHIAVNSLVLVEDVAFAKAGLEKVGYSLLPVKSDEDRYFLEQVAEAIKVYDPATAELWLSDPQSNVPESYVPVIRERESTVDKKHVSILFIGGMDEEQGETFLQVKRRLADDQQSGISIKFEAPGWKSGWSPVAERIENHISEYDVIILMPLVRTNFGRRIRRIAGDNRVNWFACTGRGQGSVMESITRAAEWVRSQQ